MKVSGFTFIKNAAKYDYPIVESIRSILPVVDEYIVCLGDSEDDTGNLVKSIVSEKIKIINSIWDKSLRDGGEVLAAETNKAMDATDESADWLFYLQGDEVVNEKYLPVIYEAMEKYKDDKKVEGFLFRYLHFYGSYKYVGDGRKWYSKEIRIIRNNKHIRAYRDAQGFRIGNKKLKVKQIEAYIYHYGWVRAPLIMQNKVRDFRQYWSDEQSHNLIKQQKTVSRKEFDYSEIDSLKLFEGTHPEVMKERFESENWNFEYDIKRKKFKNLRHRFLYKFQQLLGIRLFEYRNYKRI